jgi:hypothetical protein
MTLTDLPPEMIHLIADLLEVGDLLALIVTSRHIARLIDPVLQDTALTYRGRLITFRSDLSRFEVAAAQGKHRYPSKTSQAHPEKRIGNTPERQGS